MNGKIMIVTYHAIRGVPTGRHEQGRVIIHSGDYGRSIYGQFLKVFKDQGFSPSSSEVQDLLSEAAAAANGTVSELKRALMSDDIRSVDEIYIYVGVSAMESAMGLIRDLKKLGKNVRMIACDCDQSLKAEFASNLGLGDVIWSECGGRRECADLIRKFLEEVVEN